GGSVTRSQGRLLPRNHVELARRESLDDDHDAATLGTGRWCRRRARLAEGRGERLTPAWVQHAPTAWEILGAASRRQEAIEADPDEALGQHVEAEAPAEFVDADGHQPQLTAVAVILPSKGHLVVGHVDDPMIR